MSSYELQLIPIIKAVILVLNVISLYRLPILE